MRSLYALACGRVNIPTHTPITYSEGGCARIRAPSPDPTQRCSAHLLPAWLRPRPPHRPDRTAPDPGPWSSSVVAGTRAPARQPAPRDLVAVATVRTRTRKARAPLPARPALSAVLSAPVRQIGRSRPRGLPVRAPTFPDDTEAGEGGCSRDRERGPQGERSPGIPPVPVPRWPVSVAAPRGPPGRWTLGCSPRQSAPRVYAYRVCAGREARSCGNTPERTVTATHRKPTREGRCDPPTTRASVFTVGVLV